jgi:hypothetical protein
MGSTSNLSATGSITTVPSAIPRITVAMTLECPLKKRIKGEKRQEGETKMICLMDFGWRLTCTEKGKKA